MNIEYPQLNFTINSNGANIFLAQLNNDIDPVSKRLCNIENKVTAIENVFENINVSKDVSFLVFPEVSVPLSYLDSMLSNILSFMPNNSVTIFGLELITIAEYRNVIIRNRHSISENVQLKDQLKQENEKLVNVAFVVSKSEDGIKIYLQLKIQHSKFEGDIEYDKSTLQSNVLKIFKAENITFTVLICSDFFNRPQNEHQRIVDNIDSQIFNEGKELDFIFNIQHNRSPDHHFFIHSLNRIYDDGHTAKANICIFFLNSIFGLQDGGLSKVMIFKNKAKLILENKPIKLLNAPVTGIEIPLKEVLIKIYLDLPPRLWPDNRNQYPFTFDLTNLDNNAEKVNKDYKILMPMEEDQFLDFKSCAELSNKMSDLGKFQKAIELQSISIKYYENKHDYKSLAKVFKFIATQYRHLGNFQKALKNYSLAKSNIFSINKKKDFDICLLSYTIEAGKIMTEDYLSEADCEATIQKYKGLSSRFDRECLEICSQLSEAQKITINSYQNHLNRQIAELERVIGMYDDAIKKFNNAFESYSLYEIEEKGYCLLGLGNTYKMLEQFELTLKYYEKAEQIAKHHKYERLLVTIFRQRCELFRCKNFRCKNDESIINELDKLRKFSFENDMRFGKIYYWIIIGCYNLLKDTNFALTCFKNSLLLCEPDSDYVTKLELGHTYFGMAESFRILGSINEALDYYNKAKGIYKQFVWGQDLINKAKASIPNKDTIFIDNLP